MAKTPDDKVNTRWPECFLCSSKPDCAACGEKGRAKLALNGWKRWRLASARQVHQHTSRDFVTLPNVCHFGNTRFRFWWTLRNLLLRWGKLCSKLYLVSAPHQLISRMKISAASGWVGANWWRITLNDRRRYTPTWEVFLCLIKAFAAFLGLFIRIEIKIQGPEVAVNWVDTITAC